MPLFLLITSQYLLGWLAVWSGCSSPWKSHCAVRALFCYDPQTVFRLHSKEPKVKTTNKQGNNISAFLTSALLENHLESASEFRDVFVFPSAFLSSPTVFHSPFNFILFIVTDREIVTQFVKGWVVRSQILRLTCNL